MLQHPWQLSLAVLGIAVGVAVIVAIRLTQHSAFAAFDTATRSSSAHATHRVLARNGLIPHKVLRELMRAFPAIAMSPVLRARVRLVEPDDRALVLLGIDFVSRAALVAPSADDEIPRFEDPALLGEPNTAVISATTARELQLSPGMSLRVRTRHKNAALEILDILPRAGDPGGLVANALVVDIATAQEVLQVYDRITHIDLVLARPSDAQDIAAVLESFADDLTVIDLEVEAQHLRAMTAAFYSNLNALSLMALLVGMFLIYNTETFLLLQRRESIGRLRAVGAGRRQLLLAILAEATCLGIVGGLAGLVLGIGLARGLLSFVAATVNDLYFSTSITNLAIDTKILVVSLCIGIVTTITATLVPAYHTIRQEPNIVMGRGALTAHNRKLTTVVAMLICGACNLAAWMVLRSSTSPELGFVGISLVVLGFAALCPILILLLAGACDFLIRRTDLLPEHLGLHTVMASLNRSGTATAALMVATAASIGIAVMVTSFRGSVTLWLDQALRADLYIADHAIDNFVRDRKIPPQVIADIERVPQVLATSNVLRHELRQENKWIRVSAFTLTAKARRGFRFLAGDPQAIWAQWRAADVVIVTEPYAFHNRVALYDEITLDTATGAARFRVVGIYQDYASERGGIAMSRATYDRHWESDGYDGIGVYADARVDLAQLQSQVKAALAPHQSLIINTSDMLKRRSLEVFDRTFLITELLRTIAVIVSFIGVFGALLAQQLERTREYGLLRAVGLNDPEMFRTVLTQTIVVGATAALVAIPVGLLIGGILIEVINPRSFGWSMRMAIPPAVIAGPCVTAFLAALCAGIYPSYRATRVAPAGAMRDE